MTPVLAMTVVREAAIAAFVPEKFYTVDLELTSGCTASSTRFAQKADAELLLSKCRKEGRVTVQKMERKEKSESPPQLYDLTALQRDANRLLGFTAQQTLDYAQSLYEKRLITYPRTDSRFLTEDMVGFPSGTGDGHGQGVCRGGADSHPCAAGHQWRQSHRPPCAAAYEKHGKRRSCRPLPGSGMSCG